MKLKSVRVQNFRSVEDSGEFTVEHLTCLVGKNEAGKTAILQAIEGLNPHKASSFKFEIERDYPKRYLARYDERHPDKPAVVVTTKWTMEPELKEEIESEFGPGSVVGDTITVARGYGTGPLWTLPVNDAKAIEYLIAGSNYSAPEKSQVGSPKDSAALIAKLQDIAGSSPKHQALLTKVSAYPHSNIHSRVRELCEGYFPEFLYSSNYDRMEAAVHLTTLKAQAENESLFTNDALRGQRLFWEFLEYANVSVSEILEAETFENLNSRLQAASNTLTSEILDYWTQNQYIEVRVNVAEGRPGDPPPFNSGAVGRARIFNTLHKADTSFSERSAGFIWFFSFLIKFDRVKKDADGEVFLLLDEPGLTLHGLAQADLLRFFDEKLSPHHTIIFSTHSPFMVPHEKLMSSRIVEDLVTFDDRHRPTPIGTKVRDDVLNADKDSIFPLQGALGYSLTQSLFIGKHTILVEGPGDILYIQALSAELARRKRTGLDPEWVLCPAGGIDKIHTFVSLFGGNKLDVIALSDYARKDAQKIDALKKAKIVKDGGVLTVANFVHQEEADVEDIFDPVLFCQIVNGTYELTGGQKLDPTKLMAADANTVRQVKKVEAYFNVLPEPMPLYSHFDPAAWLLSNPGVLAGDGEPITKTLDRAEVMFKALNALKKQD